MRKECGVYNVAKACGKSSPKVWIMLVPPNKCIVLMQNIFHGEKLVVLSTKIPSLYHCSCFCQSPFCMDKSTLLLINTIPHMDGSIVRNPHQLAASLRWLKSSGSHCSCPVMVFITKETVLA